LRTNRTDSKESPQMSSAPPAASGRPDRRASRLGVDAGHASYKWWALSCTSLGMLLAATNSGTLIIALPDLERSLHTSLLALVWVILAYLIAATVLVLMAGRLSDLFGRKRAYVGGFLVFAIASLGAGFSGDATVLILWRVLQGIGSAFLFANAAALVTDAFPREELGLAMGANTMVAAIGLVLGPVLGGALVAISWHWVFWFNVPFALAGAAWGASVLRELAKPDSVRGYDVLGTSTFVIGLTGLV
jgi:MFS family permease